MGKIKTTLTLDEEVLEVAKRTFPNLSKTVNDILKEMLDLNRLEKINLITRLKMAEERVLEDKKKIASIHHLLDSSNSISAEEIETKEKDRIWRLCLGEANQNRRMEYYVNETNLNNAIRILGMDKEPLMELIEEVVDECHCNCDDYFKCQKWNYIIKNYLGAD